MLNIQRNDVIFNLVGQRYRVLAGGPWLFRVQPLTLCGTEYVPLGGPVALGRSEIDNRRLIRGAEEVSLCC